MRQGIGGQAAKRFRGPLAVLALLAVVAAAAFTWPTTASGDLSLPAVYSGYSTGTVLHLDALQSGATRVANVDVGFSGASVSSRGIGARILNEMQRVVQPETSGENGYARGSGVELGALLSPPTAENQITAGKVEATQAGQFLTQDIPVSANPAVYASIARGQAANNCDPACIPAPPTPSPTPVATGSPAATASPSPSPSPAPTQSPGATASPSPTPARVVPLDLAFGLGYVARLQLINSGIQAPDGRMTGAVVGLDAPKPERAVSQSVSRTNVEIVTFPTPSPTPAATGSPTPAPTATPTPSPAASPTPSPAASPTPTPTPIETPPDEPPDGPTVEPGTPFTGMVSEARVTVAPITLFGGSTNQVTIEVLGEWVLRAVAGGLPGTTRIRYGPRDVSPETPILRTINAAGVVSNVLTFQTIFGATGRQIAVPGVAEIAIGEAPRAIGGAYGSAPMVDPNGRLASAAIDVLRIRLLEQRNAVGEVTTRAADLRLGHMEVRAFARVAQQATPTPTATASPTASPTPPGQTPTPPDVTKTAQPDQVFVGQSFTTPIRIRNTYDCEARTVRVVDNIETEPGRSARFRIVNTTPQANSVPPGEMLDRGTVVWDNIGPIPPGETREVQVAIQAQAAPENIFPATIIDRATAEATYVCADGRALANAQALTVSQPQSVVVNAVLQARELPRTGSDLARLILIALTLLEIGLALVLLATRRRHALAR